MGPNGRGRGGILVESDQHSSSALVVRKSWKRFLTNQVTLESGYIIYRDATTHPIQHLGVDKTNLIRVYIAQLLNSDRA
jgi:hypothetical protein